MKLSKSNLACCVSKRPWCFVLLKIFLHVLFGTRERELGHTVVLLSMCWFVNIYVWSTITRAAPRKFGWTLNRAWIQRFFFSSSHQSRQSSSASRCVSQIENYIKESMKAEMAQLQQSAVHNHTAAMLEMGTNLLSQTAEQTRKLTDVETQVRTLGCFAVVVLLFVFNSKILLQCKWDREMYGFLALHFQLCDGGWWLFVEVWSGWLVMLCWLLYIIGLFLGVLFLIVLIYCVCKMPLSHFKLLLELKQWID